MNAADAFLVAMFLFFIGSLAGYIIEVFYRRFVSAKRWINPGFLTGPWLPLYGFGVVGLFGISLLPIHTGARWADALIIILVMGAAMTLIEYIAGLIFIKGLKIRLWDYSKQWGNVQGIICPLYSFFWLIVSAFFYFVVDRQVIAAVTWFVSNIEFAFVVGVLLGVFLVDLGHSIGITHRIRKFAEEHNVVVHFEKLKEALRDKVEGAKEGLHAGFVFPFTLLGKFKEQLAETKEQFSSKAKRK